ncbi:hypothetical protein [Paenibacillus sp. KN14-4R]|uniref:hypothetical protein n=1 Tax=Paenibacillus sp. KN14-4R TaxID=3445773 RepID=UPI003F9FA770
MPSIVEVGPLVIKGVLLTLILSCLAGFLYLALQLRKTAYAKSPLYDIFASALLILFLSWKLGPLLSEPSLLWENPIKLLVVAGSADGMIFGVILALVFVQVKMRKKGLSALLVLDAGSYFAIAATLVYQILTPVYGYATKLPWGIADEYSIMSYHPIHLYMGLLCGIGIAILYVKRSAWKLGEGAVAHFVLMLFGVGGLGISLLAPQQIAFLYLSKIQLLYIVFALASIALTRLHPVGIEAGGDVHTNAGKE